jgi:hypothetical protein
MKKNGLLLGMLALALAFGFVVTGCENDALQEGGNVHTMQDKAANVTGVTVATATDNNYAIVTFNAAANGVGYKCLHTARR